MDNLLIAHVPTGLVYCDKSREENGDYRRIANLFWMDLSFVPAKGAHGEILDRARKHAATLQARQGDRIQVSTSGQTVILGWGLIDSSR